MLGDGGEIGSVVFGRHGYGAEEETGEGGVPVEDGAALGVDVEKVEGCGGRAWTLCEACFDTAEKQLEDGGFKGVKEEGQSGGAGEVEGEGVLFVQANGRDRRGGGVGGVSGEPVVEVELCGVGEDGVELDADDLVKRELAGDEHGAAFSSAEVDEGVVVDGVRWGGG